MFGNEYEESETPEYQRVNSYGADFTVYSLVDRLERDEIYVPLFQRRFVWTQTQASQFIESLLLGFPTPNIFLARDHDGRMFIIDGQQRLLTLQYFFKGKFGSSEKKFSLRGVSEKFEGKTYEELAISDRRRLESSVIHTTVIEDFSYESIFAIFERLNTTGTPLVAQELRSALFDGEFNQLLHDLNRNEIWREIFGDISGRMKDEELILRYFALLYFGQNYHSPMSAFLNHFMQRNRNLELIGRNELSHIFQTTIETVYRAVGKKAFRVSHAINSAFFDAVMVGIAKRIQKGELRDIEGIRNIYESLLQNKEFLEFVSKSTSTYRSVYERLNISTNSFEQVR
jgi:hypothetical protein